MYTLRQSIQGESRTYISHRGTLHKKCRIHGLRATKVTKCSTYPSNSQLTSACLSVCLSVRLSVCLSVCLFVCLSVCLSVCLPVCLLFCLSACWDYVFLFLKQVLILATSFDVPAHAPYLNFQAHICWHRIHLACCLRLKLCPQPIIRCCLLYTSPSPRD